MKKLFFFALASLLLIACHESVDQKAAKEAKNYTAKVCPTPVRNNMRTDSLVFEQDTRTLHYYYTIISPADTKVDYAAKEGEFRNMLLSGLRNSAGMQSYREGGLNFAYTYFSESHPDSVVFEARFDNAELQ